MTDPKQSDYGTADSKDVTLVPGTLRAYRHFLVIGDQFYPMSGPNSFTSNVYALEAPAQRRDWHRITFDPTVLSGKEDLTITGCRCPMCMFPKPTYDSYKSYVAGTAYRAGEPFTARCEKLTYSLSAGFIDHKAGEHKAPHKECKCGFYAHYDPNEDFYDGQRWTHELSTLDAAVSGVSPNSKMIMVFAVVEMSGTVIMGTRGVRAEKQRIVAAAVDWAKYRNPYDPYTDMLEFYDFNRTRYIRQDRGPSSETMYQVENQLLDVCSRYQVRMFYRLDRMIERYPKPDISNLLGDDDDNT